MPSVAELEPEEGSTTITATKPYFAPMLVNECSHQEIPLHAQVYESEYDPFHNIEMAMPIVDDLNQITQMVASNEEKKGKNMDIKKGEAKEGKHNGVVRKQHLKKQRKKVAEEAASSSGYVYVRARRGQATDSHSLAERVRRAKISERMKLLQSLVPGCDKIKGKAVILDEIIKYVQTLQTEVEFLAAKLASISPMFIDSDFITNPLAQAHNDNWSWGNDNGERSQELANYYQYELSKFKSPI